MTSVAIIVAYTVQRLLIVIWPMNSKYKSKRSAWITVFTITVVSLTVNLWVLAVFEIKNEEHKDFCDVKAGWKNEYFIMAVVYIFLTIGLPVIIICTSNTIIAYKTIKAESKRNRLKETKKSKTTTDQTLTRTIAKYHRDSLAIKIQFKKLNNPALKPRHESFKSIKSMKSLTSQANKPYYMTVDQMVSKESNKNKGSKHITKILSLISMSFVFLNLPYLITWYFLYFFLILIRIFLFLLFFKVTFLF